MMNIFSFPFIGQLYLPVLLTSLIIGLIILIFFEKKKITGRVIETEENYSTVKPMRNGIYCDHISKSNSDNDHTLDTEGVKMNSSEEVSSEAHSLDSYVEIRGQTESTLVFNKNLDPGKVSIKLDENSQERKRCSSSSEEDTAKPESKVLRTGKKHSCSGTKDCSKKTVSQVLIVTDTEDEQIKVSLEDLAEKFKTGGLTCTTRSSQDTHQPLLEAETSHLIIFLVTSYDSCEQLQNNILKIKDHHEPAGAFVYSVACLTERSHGDVYEAAEKLNVALSGLGGVEWLPLTCITHTGETQDPEVLSSQQYITKILDKTKKLSRKCCGKSCSSKKAADIEDLAASLLPVVTPVKT